jgi:4-amino-4-deoxy-L-arabinose transferase-like glycosyltransferase
MPGAQSRILVALLLATFTVVLLFLTAPQMGLTWDEPAYIAASESYVDWFGKLVSDPAYALSKRGIDRYWTINHEHPPLDKAWSGVVWSVARFVTDDLTAHRAGNILLSGALVAMLYTVVAGSAGQVAGLAAAAVLLTMPRFFFHAHLAALDVPAAFAVFAVTAIYWETRDRRGLWWGVPLGVAWGLALATKVNALFVPITLLAWTLFFKRRLVLFGRLVVMGIVGLPLSLALWPWLYPDLWGRLDAYIRWITVDHWKIGQWYLGRFYMPPPWHFAFVITLAVVPLALTALTITGIVRAVRQQRLRAFGGLLVLSALTPLLALAIGETMVYDNDRLLMPAFPFLAALAGLGFDWLTSGLQRAFERFARPGLAKVLALIAVGALFVPHLVLAGSLYPHLLSYYSEGIGALPGAVRLGLETTYWCETYAQALPYLNAHAPPGAVVWVQDWSHDVMFYYQLQGQLRDDLQITWPEEAASVFGPARAEGCPLAIGEADYVVLQHRQTGIDDEIESCVRGRTPVYQISRQGVPLLDIYER